MLEIIKMEDVMNDYGMSRKRATKLFNTKGCPLLPRVKHAPYEVPREAFEEWLKTRKR